MSTVEHLYGLVKKPESARDHTMNVSFLENDPLNTVVTDSSNGYPLYEVNTSGMTNRITTIRRLKAGVGPGQGEIIAEVHWHTLTATMITLFGSTMRVKDYLKKDGIFSSCVTLVCQPHQFRSSHASQLRSRTFTASDGNAYKWSRGGGDKFNVSSPRSVLPYLSTDYSI